MGSQHQILNIKHKECRRLMLVKDDESARQRRRARAFVLFLLGLFIVLLVIAFTAAFLHER